MGHWKWHYPYPAGTLKAHGYRAGKEVRIEKVETSAAPAKLVIESDRKEIAANGEDLSILKISALDAAGRFVPIADNDVTFEITGGENLGVGNGKPSTHQRDRFFTAHSRIAPSNCPKSM